MYIETSSPRVNGDKARLRFTGSDSGAFCLKFFYHMFGKSVGTLRVKSLLRKAFCLTNNLW